MDQISWNDFAKIEFRIGEIVEAKAVDGSEKLIREVVDFGEFGKKVAFSGIRKYYQPQDLVGKKTVFVMNMTPKKVMGEISEVMIFAAEDEVSNQVSILILDNNLPNGSRVF